MDFFPSESTSLKTSGTPPKPSISVTGTVAGPAVPGPVAGHVNRDVSQAMKEMQGLGVALGQLRTMADDLDERYRALLETCGTADQRCRDIEHTVARIDSLAETRLGQLADAGDLAARTEKMLARVEGLSVEADRQLAAIADARRLVSRDLRDLARARSEAQSRARALDVRPPAPDYRFDALLLRLKAALTTIHETTPRPSRRAIVYAALAALAIVAVTATWPAENANLAGTPVVESRVWTAAGLQPSRLPQRVAVEAGPSGRRSTTPARAPARAAAATFTGELAIQSSPRGATVFVDGKPVGETPLSRLRIRAGSHAVWIDLAKHQRWTTAVRVRAGALTTVSATLRPAPDGQRAR